MCTSQFYTVLDLRENPTTFEKTHNTLFYNNFALEVKKRKKENVWITILMQIHIT